MLVQAFKANASVKAFDEGIVRGFATFVLAGIRALDNDTGGGIGVKLSRQKMAE